MVRFKSVAGKIISKLKAIIRPKEPPKFSDKSLIDCELLSEEFFAPILDKDAPIDLSDVVTKWRTLASDLNYDGPVLWQVKAGFTLKKHAPLAGPCDRNFSYLQEWKLQDDEPTEDVSVFFIPHIVATSKKGVVEDQEGALDKLRVKYDLPEYHLISFGSAALLSGLILANYKLTNYEFNDEWNIFTDDYVRTDTLNSDGRRLDLGFFFNRHGKVQLTCGNGYWLEYCVGQLGAFPLGIELDCFRELMELDRFRR